ncbi:hypothetical protein GCM10010468_14980 [Actinocorallia longicatena]|uniref:Restriction system protein n=2 Tax=Actinocorallia longicatena TaxID=111803 RepID=A0ABP6Q340_9ACTN
MASSFPHEARVVQFSKPPDDRSNRICVAVPAWAYRVTAPVLPRRGLDLFEKVVLGLCQSGLREPAAIGARIGLHPMLCRHIIDQARYRGLLEPAGELTAPGLHALRTGSVAEETSWSVRYVFQSPDDGDLWPRTTGELTEAPTVWRRGDRIGVRTGTHGRPDDVEATLFPAGDRLPTRPRPLQIVEVARLDQIARERNRIRELEQVSGLAAAPQPEAARLAPDPDSQVLSRVSFVDGPEPVLLLAFAEISSDGALVARDPFGGETSAMLKELLEGRIRADEQLAADVAGLARDTAEHRKKKFTEASRDIDTLLENELTVEFGHRIRRVGDTLNMMKNVDKALLENQLKPVAQVSYQLYEVLFRELVVAFPPPSHLGSTASATSSAVVDKAALEIGFQSVPSLFRVDLGQCFRNLNADKNLFLKEAGVLACAAAPAHSPAHPLYALAQSRPDLLSDLATLGQLRNRAAHADGEPATAEDARWCRDLAALAVRTLLLLP